MSALTVTSHAAVRMAQRGMTSKDAELIAMIGTEVEDGFFVRDKDFQDAEHALKRLLQRLRRVVGKRLIVSSGRIITAYHPAQKNERRILRDARDSDLLK
jgi:hypothetical protein